MLNFSRFVCSLCLVLHFQCGILSFRLPGLPKLCLWNKGLNGKSSGLQVMPKTDREIIRSEVASVSSIAAMILTAGTVGKVHAATGDIDVSEFVDEKSPYDEKTAGDFVSAVEKARPLNSDELVVEFTDSSLGLGLTEESYGGFPVVTVSSIKDAAVKERYPLLRKGAVVIGVGDTVVDGQPLKKITELVKAGARPLTVKFRDPSRYFELLDSAAGPPMRLVTSSYLPANTRYVGAAEQIIYVQRLAMPPPDQRIRSSQLLDVMEIQYVAQVSGSDKVVDSSAVRAPPGTSTGSIYYILGQRNGPPGQFPPGWDLTLRGMVVGEKRRITLPYTLAYGAKGVKEKDIPPFATVVYTVKLISLT